MTTHSSEAIAEPLTWANRDWVAHRVETVRLLNDGYAERRTSIDVDTVRVREILHIDGLAVEPILAPVAMLPKRIIYEFDLRGGANESLSVLNSVRNAVLATEILLLRASAPPPNFLAIAAIYRIALSFPETLGQFSDAQLRALAWYCGLVTLDNIRQNAILVNIWSIGKM